MSVKYSIIIPVYNAEETLFDCVRSVEEQVSDYEIILVNDGSTDSSLEVCNFLSKKNSRIRVFSTENQGQSCARNLGIRYATGDFLHFLDSDDFWLKDSFKSIEHLISDVTQLDLVLFSYRIYDHTKRFYKDIAHNSNYMEVIEGKALLFKLLIENPGFDISPCRCFIRREFLLEHQLYFEPHLYFEDAKWMFETFLSAKDSVYVDRPLFAYRKFGYQSITSAHSYKKISDRFTICKYWLDQVDNLEFSQAQRQIFLRRISQICLTGLVGIWSLKNPSERTELLGKFLQIQIYLDYPNSGLHRMVRLFCRKLGIKCGSRWVYFLMKLKRMSRLIL